MEYMLLTLPCAVAGLQRNDRIADRFGNLPRTDSRALGDLGASGAMIAERGMSRGEFVLPQIN